MKSGSMKFWLVDFAAIDNDDDILEKISQSGFESLTNVEKNKLFEQSKK